MKLSLLMPVYNEENIIERTITDYVKELKMLALTIQFIVIDDGSTDKTPEILDRLASKFNIHVIHKKKNEGQGMALRTGLIDAYGDWIIQADSDYQYDPNDFDKLIKYAYDYSAVDMVIGYRKSRKASLLRKLISFILRISVILMFGMNFKDVNSSFRLVRKKVFMESLKYIPFDFYTFNIASAIAAKKLKYNIVEVPVKHIYRVEGETKLKVMSKAWLTFWQLFKLSANLY